MRANINKCPGGQKNGKFWLMALVFLSVFALTSASASAQTVTATHSATPFESGGNMVVTTQIEYTEDLSALGIEIDLPDEWSYAALSYAGPAQHSEKVTDTGDVEFFWLSIPASPIVFKYTVRVPLESATTGLETIIATVKYRYGSGGELQAKAQPNPLDPYILNVSHVSEKYTPGQELTVTNRVTYTGRLSSLGLETTLPAGWTYASLSGDAGDVPNHTIRDNGNVEFFWTTPPPSTVDFSYTVNVPEDAEGDYEISTRAFFSRSAGQYNEAVLPDPLVISETNPVGVIQGTVTPTVPTLKITIGNIVWTYTNTDDYYITHPTGTYTLTARATGYEPYATTVVVSEDSIAWHNINLTLTGSDVDGDGISDELDNCLNTYNPDQTDQDGDETGDACDQCPNDVNKIAPGQCGCGVEDADSDNDGTLDCHDACPYDLYKIIPGVCGCGIADTDSDGDGTPNCNDQCPSDVNKIVPGYCGCNVPETDSDNDGVPDCIEDCDKDSDGDGTPDCKDQCPNDVNKIEPGACGCGSPDTDSDWDGVADCNDGCPSDPYKIAAGLCGCGTPDTDSDSDGTPNCNDQCPNDPYKTAPGSCGCGIPDTDGDSDGTPNCNDQCPSDPDKIEAGLCGCGASDADSNNDGLPDCQDNCDMSIDTDSDGTPDCNDRCREDENKTEPGICGCGIPDTDSDGDGFLECTDGCPNDPEKTEPGLCGCGVADTDSDEDETPNCNDGCPNDPDKIQSGLCGCGIPDTDSDNDGKPDCYDIPEGYMVTPDLWIRAVIESEEKGDIEAIWVQGGSAETAAKDRVIWGHFHANPSDVTWGSPQNPDLFVKIWFDHSGRLDVNYFHVSVPNIRVYSDYPYDGEYDRLETTTMDIRYIRHYYQDGLSYTADPIIEDGNPPEGFSPGNNPAGNLTINDLRFGAVINTVEKGSVDAVWRLGGNDTTTRGDKVVWGLFYANPDDVTWGSRDNPDLFVKIWFDVGGRVDVNFFHVSVPDIEVYSELPNDGSYDNKGTTIMDNRYIRHEYKIDQP